MQTTSTPFRSMSTSSYQYPLGKLRVSWLRRLNTGASYAKVDTSVVDGGDIVQGNLTVITPSDLFQYFIEDERLLRMRIEKHVTEPIGSIEYATFSATLENTDKRFTYNVNSTIGTAILPKRPVIAHLGFQIKAKQETLQMFKGLLDRRPVEDNRSATVTLTAFDYMSYLDNYKIESAIKVGKRTDELIQDILIDAGFNSSQYVLEQGLNTVGFAWFEKDQLAGKIIRDLCAAEEGHFFQDETGVLRFQTRRTYNSAPYNVTQHTIDKSDIIHYKDISNTSIINRCVVLSSPREVQGVTEIWRDGAVQEISSGATLTVWATFEDPVNAFQAIAQTTDYLGNTAADGTGSDISSDISIVVTPFTKNAKLVITNNNASTAHMTLLRLRGTPATVTSQIEQTYENTNSINKFGEIFEHVIRNDYIDSATFAYYLARALVSKYSGLSRRLKIRVATLPHIQLRDRVSVQDPNSDAYITYRVVGITHTMNGPSLLTDLILREVTAFESDQEAVVDSSTVDGADVVGV